MTEAQYHASEEAQYDYRMGIAENIDESIPEIFIRERCIDQEEMIVEHQRAQRK